MTDSSKTRYPLFLVFVCVDSTNWDLLVAVIPIPTCRPLHSDDLMLVASAGLVLKKSSLCAAW